MSHDADDQHRLNAMLQLYGRGPDTGYQGRLLRTGDVASLFQVSERTVSEWARRGRLPSVRTPGGQRRYPADRVHELFMKSIDLADGEKSSTKVLP